MNAIQLNAVLNGVHFWLNAELNDLQFSELDSELNAVQTERSVQFSTEVCAVFSKQLNTESNDLVAKCSELNDLLVGERERRKLLNISHSRLRLLEQYLCSILRANSTGI